MRMIGETCELQIKHLKDTKGDTIRVPVVVVKGPEGKVIRKLTYKQFKMVRKQLPPLQLSQELKKLLAQSAT